MTVRPARIYIRAALEIYSGTLRTSSSPEREGSMLDTTLAFMEAEIRCNDAFAMAVRSEGLESHRTMSPRQRKYRRYRLPD